MTDAQSHQDREQAVDLQFGVRLRAFRRAAGLSQTELGRKIGVSFQQVQKYENGANRIAASRLWLIAQCLGHPVSAFLADPEPSQGGEGLRDDERLVRAWRQLDVRQRDPILTLVESLASGTPSKRAPRSNR